MMSFITILKKYNILLMCKTWTTEIPNVDIGGFRMFAAHRDRQKSTARRIYGGAIMCIDNDILLGTSQLHGGTDEAVWVKLAIWHMQLYMSWYIRSFFGFTFLNILYFFKYSCTNIFHRRSLYTLFSNWQGFFQCSKLYHIVCML